MKMLVRRKIGLIINQGVVKKIHTSLTLYPEADSRDISDIGTRQPHLPKQRSYDTVDMTSGKHSAV
jgi:hypothetical protein